MPKCLLRAFEPRVVARQKLTKHPSTEDAAIFYQNGMSPIMVAKLSGKTKSWAMVALVRMDTRCSKLRNWKKKQRPKRCALPRKTNQMNLLYDLSSFDNTELVTKNISIRPSPTKSLNRHAVSFRHQSLNRSKILNMSRLGTNNTSSLERK